MAFGFFGRKVGFTLGGLAFLVLAPFAFGFLRDYPVLLSSLTAYGISTVVCVLVSLLSNENFDFDCINERVVAFHYNPVPETSDKPAIEQGDSPCPATR
jgi:hypothetical protein